MNLVLHDLYKVLRNNLCGRVYVCMCVERERDGWMDGWISI